MGKTPVEKRTYAKAIKALRDSRKISPEQVRREKCERSKGRQISRMAERRSQAEERNTYWASLPVEQKLAELDKRPGECRKQRQRILRQVKEN